MIIYGNKYCIKKSLAFFLVGISLLLIDSCGTTDNLILSRPINAYVTFNKVDFSVYNDESLAITLIFNCQDTSQQVSSEVITDRIATEIKDIANNCGIAPPSIAFQDTAITVIAVANDFKQASNLISNITNRLNVLTKHSRFTNDLPVFDIKFIPGVNEERAYFNFSPSMFAQNSRISFYAENGNVRTPANLKNQDLKVFTSTFNKIEFLLDLKSIDSTKISKSQTIIIGFNRPPVSWWVKTKNSISKLFASDDLPPSVRDPIDFRKVPPSDFQPYNFLKWAWINDKISFISGVITITLGIISFRQIAKKAKLNRIRQKRS